MSSVRRDEELKLMYGVVEGLEKAYYSESGAKPTELVKAHMRRFLWAKARLISIIDSGEIRDGGIKEYCCRIESRSRGWFIYDQEFNPL